MNQADQTFATDEDEAHTIEGLGPDTRAGSVLAEVLKNVEFDVEAFIID